MGDYSWVEGATKNVANIFGLDPEAKAKGALLQKQQAVADVEAQLKQGELGLIPHKKEKLIAETRNATAKATLDEDKTKANSRLGAAIAKHVFVDENGDTQFDPNGIAEIAAEFPHVNLDLGKFAKGLAELRLQSKRRGAAPAGIAKPNPAGKMAPAPAGEIMQAPVAESGKPINLSGLLAGVGGAQQVGGVQQLGAGQPEDPSQTLSRLENERLVSQFTPQPSVGTINMAPPQGAAELLSGANLQQSNEIGDAQLRRRMLQAGYLPGLNTPMSDKEGTAIRTENADNTIRINAAKPVTLGVGQQAYGQDGKPIAENTMARNLAAGASLVDANGNIIVTAPKAGAKGKGTGAGGAGGESEATTLDVNRSNEWIARAKEVVSEWAGSSSDFPISPGVASQLAAHAYQQYFGKGMPTRNADEVMREYLSKSGYKFDNTEGNWNPFDSNSTEVYDKNGKVITGGSDSPIQATAPGSVPAGSTLKGTDSKEGGALMKSPDGSSPDKPHFIGMKKPGGGVWEISDMKPGMVFMAKNAEDRSYHIYQAQPDGKLITVDDATERGNLAYQLYDLQNAGFTVFGSDMDKNKRFLDEKGQTKVYKPYEAVNVRHLLAPGTGLLGGVSSWGWVNRIGDFGELQNMLRYIAKSETGDESFRAFKASPTVNAYYKETDPNKKMDILQDWLDKKVAPIRAFNQREEEASKAQKAKDLASTLSDTK